MITALQVAIARGATARADGSIDGGEFERTGIPLFGGCCRCGASIAAYNAFPGQNGYWHCDECIEGDGGFETVEQFEESTDG